jgi:glyoxylase-like metal-dependent hydrolase (beta-lactamase superfamily II)
MTMAKLWTRRQVLAQAGIAAAAVYTLDPHELCCGVQAHAQTSSKEDQRADEGDPRIEPRAGRGLPEGLQGMKPALPTRTVSSTATIQEGGREIQLQLLGRAHTDGDLFIYLPKEKVVATGDAVIDWMPFLNDGYPEEWIQTVAALEKLDIVTIIPGHGEPQPKSHLAFFRGYMTDLVASVRKADAAGATLDEMKTKIGDELAPKYEAGMSKHPVGRYRPHRRQRRDGVPEGPQQGLSAPRSHSVAASVYGCRLSRSVIVLAADVFTPWPVISSPVTVKSALMRPSGVENEKASPRTVPSIPCRSPRRRSTPVTFGPRCSTVSSASMESPPTEVTGSILPRQTPLTSTVTSVPEIQSPF